MSSNEIIIIGIILIAILFFVFKYINLNKKIKTEEKKTENFQTKLSIKFFGADYCPYSNKSSAAYKAISDFDEKNSDVLVEYFWVGKDDDLMNKLQIETVPTIYNNRDEDIELSLPKGISHEGKTVDELKKLLFENIRNQL